jgi:hypothetical protein
MEIGLKLGSFLDFLNGWAFLKQTEGVLPHVFEFHQSEYIRPTPYQFRDINVWIGLNWQSTESSDIIAHIPRLGERALDSSPRLNPPESHYSGARLSAVCKSIERQFDGTATVRF